jgi:hypothetical protein
MTKRLVFGLGAVVVMPCAPMPLAQEREDRTLLSAGMIRPVRR